MDENLIGDDMFERRGKPESYHIDLRKDTNNHEHSSSQRMSIDKKMELQEARIDLLRDFLALNKHIAKLDNNIELKNAFAKVLVSADDLLENLFDVI